LTDRASLSRESVRRELEEYLEGRASWPTVREFARDRKSQLRRVLIWFDTPEHWASEFGLEIGDKQRSRRSGTYERLRDDMALFAAGRTDWPTCSEFMSTGRKSLYDKIMAKRLRPELAADLGLTLPKGRRSHAREPRSA
jgi:hypothetical protein